MWFGVIVSIKYIKVSAAEKKVYLKLGIIHTIFSPLKITITITSNFLCTILHGLMCFVTFLYPKFLFCSRMFTLFLPIHTSFLESQEKYIIPLYLCSRMRKSKITYRLIFQITIAPTSQNVVSGCPLRMQAGVEKVSFLMICTWKGRTRSSDIEITTQNLERSTSRKKTYAIIEAIMHEDAFKKKLP